MPHPLGNTCCKLGLTAAFAIHFAGAGHAQVAPETLDLVFEPPKLTATEVCVPRANDAALLAQWAAWDGKTIPDVDVGLINRDMRRLAEIDAVAWDTTIQRVITLLPGISPSFTEEYVLLARIEQLIAIGGLQELKALGLVQQLLDRGSANSPRMQYALAGLLGEGIGIARDSTQADEMLMSAAYGGNADALLKLSKRKINGDAPAAWDIAPELAVTMAFGALVGQLDPLICDRISRIAREYSSGEVVTANHDIAVRWYRFAADLGDPLAAWRVAEYELQSELVTKDNDVLLTYLERASAGGLPYAQVALGRVYETGALRPADQVKAQELYERAAAAGDRAGLIRLSGYLESRLQAEPELHAAFVATLEQLSALADAPAWAFAKRASIIMAEKGRWGGEAEARVLLEKGADLNDPTAIELLAQIDLGHADTEAKFYHVVDRLTQAVSNLGIVAPASELQNAYLCKAPSAPMVEEAAYWTQAEDSIGSSSLRYSEADLSRLASKPDPLVLAALQTQALYGRATPMANLMALLDRTDASPSAKAFWTAFADRFPNVQTARGSLALELARTPADRAAALDILRQAVADGEAGAGVVLGKAFLDSSLSSQSRAEAAAFLLPAAAAGQGAALQLLLIADPDAFPDVQSVVLRFADVIESRGDFQSLLMAVPFLPDIATRTTYIARARAVMGCTFDEAIAFAQTYGHLGDDAEIERWLRVAAILAGEDAWPMVVLADTQRDLLGEDAMEPALALYRQAYALGNRTAMHRLLAQYADVAAPRYDPEYSVEIYLALIEQTEITQIPDVLKDLSRKSPDIRRSVEEQLDLGALYQRSAEAGNPMAMREHASRLRGTAANLADITISTNWLIRASEGGDAPAMVMLSQAYSMGVGVTPSVTKARAWLQKAADAGDQGAVDMVKLLVLEEDTNQ